MPTSSDQLGYQLQGEISTLATVAKQPMECSAKDLDQADFRQRLYKDLSETEYRVVHLLPGKFLDEIQCVLETRPCRVKTRYEALSYVWGDDLKNTKPI